MTLTLPTLNIKTLNIIALIKATIAAITVLLSVIILRVVMLSVAASFPGGIRGTPIQSNFYGRKKIGHLTVPRHSAQRTSGNSAFLNYHLGQEGTAEKVFIFYRFVTLRDTRNKK